MNTKWLNIIQLIIVSTSSIILLSCSIPRKANQASSLNSVATSKPTYALWVGSNTSYIDRNRIGLEQKIKTKKKEFYTNCVSEVVRKNIEHANLSFDMVDFLIYEKSEAKLDEILLSIFAQQAVASKAYLSAHRTIRQRYPDVNDKKREDEINKLKVQYELKQLPNDIEQLLHEYENTLSFWLEDSIRKLEGASTNYRDFFGLAYMVKGDSTLPLGNLNNRVHLTGGRMNCSGWRIWALRSDRFRDIEREKRLYRKFENAIEDKMVSILNEDIEEFKRLVYRLNSIRLLNKFAVLYVMPEITRNALKRSGLYPLFLDKWRDLHGGSMWKGDNNANLPYYRN